MSATSSSSSSRTPLLSLLQQDDMKHNQKTKAKKFIDTTNQRDKRKIEQVLNQVVDVKNSPKCIFQTGVTRSGLESIINPILKQGLGDKIQRTIDFVDKNPEIMTNLTDTLQQIRTLLDDYYLAFIHLFLNSLNRYRLDFINQYMFSKYKPSCGSTAMSILSCSKPKKYYEHLKSFKQINKKLTVNIFSTNTIKNEITKKDITDLVKDSGQPLRELYLYLRSSRHCSE